MCSAFTPSIRTERLTLRAPRLSDAPRIAELCADFDITRMTTRMPWPYGIAEARAFVEHVARQDPSRDATFLVEHEGDGVIGCVGLFTKGRAPEIGYWIGRPYWGQGFATEATEAALDWARDDWRKKVVVAGHFADNPASGAVLCKTGFLYTGDVEMRDSLARQAAAPTRMMVWLA